ncbi:trigger factor [Mesoplasma entomophilum]|uniref:Trigger factor n=1 Tax=Mesoplasma entomophilum TaxID=2149 RepID=A0A3S5XZ86_9MOLU|nr:trigger factor [Mesoplasma entomophilum]ATQ35563.1 trigger factor [Mesoplasma entomophilum]ATZ19527.1 trigger factor [Mesoplasma entomophilum]
MKFTELKIIEEGQGKWIVTIDGTEWTETLKKAKNRVLANLEVPGFRKGKIPAAQAEKYVTPSKVYNEAYRIMVSPAFDFARAQDVKIEPMNSPEPIPAKVSEKELVIEFLFDLKPEIKLGDYKNIKSVKKETVEVTNEEIEAVIDQYCEQFVMEKPKAADAKIAKGDIVTFDFKGFIDGEAFKGGEAKGHKLVIGSNQFIPGFEDSMIGLGLGEAKINVTFPEGYTPELANKPATFELNITEIKARELPKKDDELVKDLNLPNVETFAQFEAKVKEDIAKQKSQNVKNQFVNEIIAEVIKNSTIELPKSAIENQAADLRKEFEAQLKQQGLDIKKYKKVTGLNDDAIKAELLADAKNKLETYLVTTEIRSKEKFEVTEEAINAKFENLAAQFGIPADQIKTMVNPEMLKSEIINDLLVDFLYSNNG